MKNFCFLKVISTLILNIRLKLHKNKGFLFLCKGTSVIGNVKNISIEEKLILGLSHYKSKFYKKGILSVNQGKLIIKGEARIFTGFKIDVFDNAKIVIGDGTVINDDSKIGIMSELRIGNNCLIGDNCSIHDYDGHIINGSMGCSPIYISDNVWIGRNVEILKGVTIGEGSIVGAGSVVTKNIPDHVIVAGNPARIIKQNVSWER
ncbi:MAG: acyltransferase [Clostridioides difficile]|nr:acyltransferase [Streptococcus lutetiensis]MDU2662709.1 acyltransferase [Clostridioides difficile]MDU2675876.1 acyltransferase [Streptococcus lutetiensis]